MQKSLTLNSTDRWDEWDALLSNEAKIKTHFYVQQNNNCLDGADIEFPDYLRSSATYITGISQHFQALELHSQTQLTQNLDWMNIINK